MLMQNDPHGSIFRLRVTVASQGRHLTIEGDDKFKRFPEGQERLVLNILAGGIARWVELVRFQVNATAIAVLI